MKIKLLDESVYSKIAAGEVIDKPASIVRELIDNCMDAHASEIIITLKKGGIEEITVQDNGDGIGKEDLPAAILKHSTSKIKNVDDLYHIQTMGFRGEALYSVNTISKMSIQSNTDSNGILPGYKISFENNFQLQPVPCRKGTKIEIKDIFYNLPARKKFLKSSASELNSIKTTVIEKVFSNLHIAYSLYHEGKLIFQTSGNGDFAEAFFAVHKTEDPFPIEKWEYHPESEELIRLSVFHSQADLFFQGRKYQSFYVNRRPINCSFFYPAISNGYASYVSPNRYPLVFVFLEIEPSLLDINIHPTKREVKFQNQQVIFEAVMKAVSSAFSQILKRDLKLQDSPWKIAEKKDAPSSQPHWNNSDRLDSVSEKNADSFHYLYSSTPLGGKKENTKGLFEQFYQRDKIDLSEIYLSDNEIPYLTKKEGEHDDCKIHGVLFDTYIIAEKADTVYFIDQHAVEEAYLYLQKKEQYRQNHTSDKLLLPLLFELKKNPENLTDKIEELNHCGFLIEENEGNSFTIREVPSVIAQMAPSKLTETIEEYLEEENSNKQTIIERILITASCREAVKKGDKLTPIEIKEMVRRFFHYGITNCPHGRPVYFEISKNTFEKNFQRKR